MKSALDEKELLTYLEEARRGISSYLTKNKKKIRPEILVSAEKKVPKNLEKWLLDEQVHRLSPGTREGIIRAIRQKQWARIIDAFIDDIAFGTGGIRGVAAFAAKDDESELERLYQEGIQAPILKGPNTINDIVLMIKSTGVAQYAAQHGLHKMVIGYDSRIQGQAFAELIAKVFLTAGIQVYLFDEACPYPELTFAIPYLGADFGILISASHNDRRYNGYKLSARTGAQFEKKERDVIFYKYISKVDFDNIKIDFDIHRQASRLTFIGGSAPLPQRNYYGREKDLIDIHHAHREHINSFLLDPEMVARYAPQVRLGFAAYHGAGRIAVPELLHHFNFNNLQVISKLNSLDGRFPCFALEQQPDPGDPIAAEVAVQEFKQEYGAEAFEKVDMIIGTDPDADRAGFIVKAPPKQIATYRQINKKSKHLNSALKKALPNYVSRDDYSWHLLDADNAWTLLLWYRLFKEAQLNGGAFPGAESKFISLSHITSDSITLLAKKHGLGVIKTWVGFGFLANSVNMVWSGKKIEKLLDRWRQTPVVKVKNKNDLTPYLGKKLFKGQAHPVLFSAAEMDNYPRAYNFATLEQSNGFSILGPKPQPGEVWGKGGHVRDKDGTFAAILLAEVLAYAKSIDRSFIELLDEKIYLDKDIGLFINYYEPEPYWGQFEGPAGLSKKIQVLEKVEELARACRKGERLVLAKNYAVRSVEAYRTGKYDANHRWRLYPSLGYYNGFPDEGIRFFFQDELNYLTVRPSGTSQCLRFHVQLRMADVNAGNLSAKKKEGYELARELVGRMREWAGV